METGKDITHLVNSDENILKVLKQSNDYLEANKKLYLRIDEMVWIHRSLSDLVPQTLENLGSGHIFPLLESEYELESSIELCKLGFYKHALIALRNVLELGLLSVYWDIDGKSHIDIRNWLFSIEPTPFKNTVFTKLRTNPNIKKFDGVHKIFDETASLYEQLSNFAHTKGRFHSIERLGKSNINRFNEESLRKWLEYMTKVVRIVTAFHILQYPVGLQHTPLDQKFGLNGPVGGFLEPFQVERIRRFFDEDVVKTLQEISDNDLEAISRAEWVNKQPDVTESELHLQIENHDKQMIQMLGIDQWVKNQKDLHKDLEKNSPDKYRELLKYWEKLCELYTEQKTVTNKKQEACNSS